MRYVAWAVLALLAVWLFVTRDPPSGSSQQARVDSVLAQGKRYRDTIERLLQEADTREDLAVRHAQRATVLRLARPTTQWDTVSVTDTASMRLLIRDRARSDSEATEWKAAYEEQVKATALLRVALDTSQVRVNTLTATLTDYRKSRTCSIAGLLPCPSRGVMFVGGVILGALATKI